MNTRMRVKAIPALLISGCVASMAGGRGVTAQHSHATPAAADTPWADLGLPEIELDFTSAAISGMPDSLEAGRYLVTIHGKPGGEDFGFGTLFLRLPDGMTFEEAMSETGANPDAPPPVFFDAVLAGGPMIMPHTGATEATAVIDLPPGDWFVAGAALSRPPIPFSVTGEMPTDLPEPKSTVTITLGEMEIQVTEGELVAGENLVRIENIGAQPHQIEVEKLPDGTTRDIVQGTLEMEMSGTPTGEVLDFEKILFVGTSGNQSGGTTMWMPLTLEPGTYGIFCFLPDVESGMPHAFMGMWDLFEIEAAE